MNLNDNARKIVLGMIKNHAALNIAHSKLYNGANVLDCGVKKEGSLEAGLLFANVCMGGLGKLSFSDGAFGKLQLRCVEVSTDFPYVACVCSQKAGWKIKGDDFFAIGSGPARILKEKSCHEETSDSAVIALETNKHPTELVSEEIAKKCGVETRNLYILAARTASLVGSVQVSARMIETALFKMERLGYDVRKIERAHGSAPAAPVVGDDSRMMGIENDMIIYGSKVTLFTQESVDVEKIPSCSSPSYGKSFSKIFREAGGDFYSVDQNIFAPAEVHIVTKSGEKSAGRLNPAMLKKSITQDSA